MYIFFSENLFKVAIFDTLWGVLFNKLSLDLKNRRRDIKTIQKLLSSGGLSYAL